MVSVILSEQELPCRSLSVSRSLATSSFSLKHSLYSRELSFESSTRVPVKCRPDGGRWLMEEGGPEMADGKMRIKNKM